MDFPCCPQRLLEQWVVGCLVVGAVLLVGGARAAGAALVVAWRLGVGIREYRELEAGARFPSWETFDRICKVSGWPQTFVSSAAR
jgi:hypothetical protein